MNTLKHLAPLGLVLLVALACANLPEGNKRSGNGNSTNSAAPSESATPSSRWNYSQYEDEMGLGRVYVASIESTNTITLDFPYSGEQHGTLSLREDPKNGKDVYLKIEQGQLLSSDYNDPVIVRFDSDKPVTFRSSGPSDHSTETLFLRGNAFATFTTKLKNAKTVRVQAPLFQGVNQVFTFDVSDFNWTK